MANKPEFVRDGDSVVVHIRSEGERDLSARIPLSEFQQAYADVTADPAPAPEDPVDPEPTPEPAPVDPVPNPDEPVDPDPAPEGGDTGAS